MSDQHLSDTPFSALPLHPLLIQALDKIGFNYCTPIQAAALPILLTGQDVAGQAQTGTGKTAAFLLATLQRLLDQPAADNRRQNQPRALIIAPSRELAIQIHKDAVPLAEAAGMTLGLVFGGTGYEQQRQTLTDGVDILIGTPGRLIDYLKQRVYDLDAIQAVVLDEADRMFDLGFIKDIRFLLRRMPPADKRLSMLFSATLSYRVKELAYEHMDTPETVTVASDSLAGERIEESAYYTANEEKIPLLLGLLQEAQPERGMIFVNTKRVADKLWSYLEGNGWSTALLTGDVPQKKRMSLLQSFQEGERRLMVATDVAARGLHIPGVTHVFNYDLPQDAEDYVHRIGRTARAGASGVAVSFACEEYSFSLPDIESYISRPIPSKPVSADLLVEPKPPVSRKNSPSGGAPARKRSGGGGGRRQRR